MKKYKLDGKILVLTILEYTRPLISSVTFGIFNNLTTEEKKCDMVTFYSIAVSSYFLDEIFKGFTKDEYKRIASRNDEALDIKEIFVNVAEMDSHYVMEFEIILINEKQIKFIVYCTKEQYKDYQRDFKDCDE
ncbi:hypothetical protein [Breznakia pachnodae]|uniref:Uncharacterized protein n=1 Tax=Breznakia pachnodae TaxID=265178 RepID=A0ABU0DZB7_9FIRM|nr:hypothetical protein [Breznakia pachnodae]MDQ0359983.1 hypothetical protein [Breznakia pachnodae]